MDKKVTIVGVVIGSLFGFAMFEIYKNKPSGFERSVFASEKVGDKMTRQLTFVLGGAIFGAVLSNAIKK